MQEERGWLCKDQRRLNGGLQSTGSGIEAEKVICVLMLMVHGLDLGFSVCGIGLRLHGSWSTVLTAPGWGSVVNASSLIESYLSG